MRVMRLRATGIAVVLAMILAITVLWPAPRHGLVLYATSDGEAELVDRFSRESGVPVTVVRLSTGPLLARIAAEATRPRWALAWLDGDIGAAALDRAGLLEHGIVPNVDWTPIGRGLVPSSAAWVPTSVTLAGVYVTWAGGSGPMGMPDPTLSGPAFPEIAGIIAQHGGWPRGQAALRAMRAAGLSISPTSPAVMEELRAGRIGRALIQSSTAFAIAAHDPHMRVQLPRTAFLMPGVVVMAKKLPPETRSQARRLIAFLLSPDAHRLRRASGTVDSFYWPVVQGLVPGPEMPSLEHIATRHLEPYRWAPHQAEITAWFENEIARR